MENATNKEWAKLMLEMDLKSQSGSIWADEKSRLQKEKEIISYAIPKTNVQILKSDPVYYDGKEVNMFPPQILE